MNHFPASVPKLLAVIATVALAGAVTAAPPTMGRPDPDRDPFRSYLDDYFSPPWKQPGWWWRARKDTPAEQYAYGVAQFEAGNLRRAAHVFEELVHTWQSSPEAPAAQLALAQTQEERGNKPRAFREYQYAVLMFPNAIPYDETVARQMALVRDMEGELGSGFLGWGESLDAEGVAELYRIVAANAPASDLAPECFFRMGEVLSGDHCRKYDLALEPYDILMARYPGSKYVPRAAYGAARSRMLLARKYPRDEKRLRAAADTIAFVLASHARTLGAETVAELSAWRDEIAAAISRTDYERAAFYDTIRRKPAAAAAAYRRFLELHPEAPEAPLVRARLAQLEGGADAISPSQPTTEP